MKNIIVILGKSGLDTSEYLAAMQKGNVAIGVKKVRVHSRDQIGVLMGIKDVEYHQTPKFFVDPDFDILDAIAKMTPIKEERTRSLWFGDNCIKVNDFDVRIILDNSGVVPVIPSPNEYRFFGYFRVGEVTTHFICGGLDVRTDKNQVATIKCMKPYMHIPEGENDRFMGTRSDD